MVTIYSDEFPLDKNNVPPTFERKEVNQEDLSCQFGPESQDYSKQFFLVYSARIRELRSSLTETATKKWGDVKILRLQDLENHENKNCVIIGTLFKHQVWKPSILRELNEDTQDSTMIPEKRYNYVGEKDTAFLEDEILRIKLVGDKVDISEIVTGVICAVYGKTTADGSFEVNDWCFPGCPPKSEISSPSTGKILIISSIDFVNSTNASSIDLLTEWITGMAGAADSQEEVASIANVLIAGNSIKSAEDKIQMSKGLMGAKAQEAKLAREISDAVKKLDKFVSQIATDCCVTLMPGQYDPANVMLPQKPIHSLMLPESRRFKSVKGVGNPWKGMIGNRFICGSSGQPIEDILRVCGETKITPIEWLERTLEWRHFCPTAPDTLPSHPFNDKDPFVMTECPDVYFVGNMPKFETKLYEGSEGQTVRLLCIPKFCATSTAILLDLQTLDVTPISFGMSQ